MTGDTEHRALTVRDAVSDDLAAIRALVAAWDADETAPPPPRGDLLSRDIVGPDAWCETLVAELDGDVAGFLMFARSFDLWSRTRGAILQEVFVRRDARRSGVARALVAELSSRVQVSGGAWISWVMLASNAEGHAFYDAIGAARRPEIAFRVLDLRSPAL